MKLEVVLPDESSTMPIGTLVDLAQQADELGFHTAYLPDHILPPGEYGATFGGVYEPLVTLGHLAAVTERIRLGTSVLVLPLRNPFVLAKQVGTLQAVSAGRMVLGVGIGWSEEEYVAVGARFRRRGRSTDEALALIRHLFTVGHGPYDGDGLAFDHGYFAPVTDPPAAIMLGGNSDAALRRAARYADSWQGLPVPPAEFAERRRTLSELAGSRTVVPGLRISWDDDRPVDQVAAEIAGYADAGAERVAVHLGDYQRYPERMSALVGAVNAAAG